MRDVHPIELTESALRQAADRALTAPPNEPAPLENEEHTRAQYLEQAEDLARELEARTPPVYRASMGDPEIDALIWFRFVECEG
jgi:hypothetical protein